MLADEVIESADPGDDVDTRVNALGPLMRWGSALSQNLRRFRVVGFDGAAVEMLRAHAEDVVRQLSEKNGRPLPPSMTG